MRNLVVLAAFVIAAGCAPSPAPAAPAATAPAAQTSSAPAPDQSVATPPIADEASCKTAGGDWRPICRMQLPACVITFNDAGKPCTDGSQCQGGKCVAEAATATPGAAVAGKCVVNSDPCGCTTLVVDGKTSATLCAD